MDMTLLTGACGGLGSAFAHLLAARGEPLLLTGRSRERLDALARALAAQYSVPVETFVCDLTDSGARQALFYFADAKEISFSRLVYVAGIDTQKAAGKLHRGKTCRPGARQSGGRRIAHARRVPAAQCKRDM